MFAEGNMPQSRLRRNATGGGTQAHVLVSVAVLVALTGFWYGWQKDRQARSYREEAERGRFFEAENERLLAIVARGQEKEQAADQARRKAEIERTTANVRGLNFIRPVDYQELRREDLGPVIEEKLTDVYTPEQLIAASYAYEVMGMLPEGYDLKSAYMKLLGEQIAAFYDQHKDKLFMFEGSPLSQLQNRIILAHELTHALQDQHFKLESFPLETTDNDDLVTAVSALIEGDATLLMGQYVLQDSELAPSWDLVGAVFGQQMGQLENAPPFLREALLFPYLKGQEFCIALWSRGGFASVDAAYKRPPLSTSQILHPERYLAEPRWRPRLSGLRSGTMRGVEPFFQNVAGEFGIRLLLREAGIADADEIAAGWDGDRYTIYRIDGKPTLVWMTAWRSGGAAQKFEASAAALRSHCWTERKDGAGRVVRVLRTAEDMVAVIDAPEANLADEAESGVREAGRVPQDLLSPGSPVPASPGGR